LGPTIRSAPRRASLNTSRSKARPASPVSRNPAAKTIAAATPASTHSPISRGTVAAGVARIARSIGPGASPIEA